MLLPDLKALRKKIKLSTSSEGDGLSDSSLHQLLPQLITYPAISAIVIAISMITKYCKKLKYKRKIVLVTDAMGPMDAEDSSEITKKIIADNMELVVVYDPEFTSIQFAENLEVVWTSTMLNMVLKKRTKTP